MFCYKCGKKVSEEADFCQFCGANLKFQSGDATDNPKVDTNKLLLSVRPIFIPWVAILSVLPIQIFLTIWGAGFFGGFSMFAVEALGLPIPKGSTFIFFGLLFFFGVPMLTYFAKKRTYEATEYRFYGDRLEYAEGFWTAEQKSILYRNVQEVSLRKGIIQRKYSLGTIYLSTPATGFSSGRSRSGIQIHDISDADQIYNVLKKIIEKQK
jgi:membrane protein YdbS with pleckstrin-like domain